MDAASQALVAGVFATREQAEAARTALRRIGRTNDDVEVRTPTPGRYRLENHGLQEIGQAIIIGIVIGAPIGGSIGLALLPAAVPAIAAAGAVGVWLSILMGGFWGAFYGGVGGMVPKVLARVDEDRWWAISQGGAERVVIARAGARGSGARTVMRRLGARFFLAEIPAAKPADAHAQAA
jgi:hypothetical protein